ncbi:MAG: c-type cytochrome, partial [Planctomycetaceae bacterium]
EVELDGQDAPLEIEYTSAGERGELKLLWSGPGFFAEPISGRALEHTVLDDTQVTAGETVTRGAELWAARRCAACHAEAASPAIEPGPALGRTAATISAEWLVNWLAAPRDTAARETSASRGHSPNLGLTREEAADVVAALRRGEPVPAAAAPSPDTGDRPGKEPAEGAMSGREIVQTVGCLACHVLDGVGTSGPWGGPDFAELAGKRTAAHWREWLENPAQLNSRHRMPLFPLSETERVVVADWLEGLTPFAGELETPAQGQDEQREASPASKERGPGPEPLAMGNATRGVALLRRHRCAACHELPAGAAEDSPPQSQPAGKAGQPGAAHALASLAGDAARGCLAAQAPVSAQQPWYRLSEAERDALLRFLN